MDSLLATYPPFPLVMERALGDTIWDSKGKSWIDLYGGHCVCSTGHSHPRIVSAIHEQSQKMIFYSTAGDIKIRHQAANRLTAFSAMDSVFFVNSGAEANENALKIAFLLSGKKSFGSFVGGWHGRTLLALSVTDDQKITQDFSSIFPKNQSFIFGDYEALNQADFSSLAAIIVEPIQSMSGIRTASKAWFQLLREKCTAAHCLLIFDEIQTGVGRLGTPYAAQYFEVEPDMITSAKGLASGFPIGALLMKRHVAEQVKPHMLGSTFGGGPLACAAMMATLDVIEEEGLLSHATKMNQLLASELRPPLVHELKGHGLLLGLKHPFASDLKAHLLSNRILVGTSSNPQVLRIMPPLNVQRSSLQYFIETMKSFGMTA